MSDDLKRTELAMRMLCAWNNLPRDAAPPDWFNHPSDPNRIAWERVAKAAGDMLRDPTPEVLAAGVEAAATVPQKEYLTQVLAAYRAMIDAALAGMQ